MGGAVAGGTNSTTNSGSKKTKTKTRDTKGPHRSAMDAKLFAVFPQHVLLLGTSEWGAKFKELRVGLSPPEIKRIKQLRRREKSKVYSQKYRDANGKGNLVWSNAADHPTAGGGGGGGGSSSTVPAAAATPTPLWLLESQH